MGTATAAAENHNVMPSSSARATRASMVGCKRMNHTCSRAALCGLAIVMMLAALGAQAPLRPEFRGRHGVVAAGRSFAADAGARVLASGGNAIDAGVATVVAAAVVEISHFGLGGEAPMIIYLARDREVVVINGQGSAPRAATPQMFAAERAIPGNGRSAARSRPSWTQQRLRLRATERDR